MAEPHDPNKTVDASSVPSSELDAPSPPRSSLSAAQRPVVLKEAQGESAHVVKPNSDAMPDRGEAGDRYQLFGEIARGGMGAVLRGRDVDLGRDLAVKVLLAKHAGRPEVARRFVEEAQIGGQLQHPGVVPVYDIGRFGDRPFFTMKLVKGQTLAALLAERADPSADLPRFLAHFLKVAQAVAYAHAKGVIHRDLKPANVMVGAFGEVQVMDWGLAKVLAEGGVVDEERASRQREEGTQIRTARSGSGDGTDTEAGSLLGTPAYMPPEQANGEVALLDRRCDVFGLGAVLCEVLTGKPPYVGRSAEEVRRKAANGDLADALARLGACGADGELIALTKACLSPEAIDRPTDAQAVADALTLYLDGVQERLRRAELAEAEARAKAAEEAKRRRLTVALAGTVLLALTLGGGGWLWVKSERDARQARLAREVNAAVSRALTMREQARKAATGSATLFAQAREQAQRALALVESGPADPELKDQVTRLQDELNEEEKDRRLMAALEEAWLAGAELIEEQGRFATERAVPKFREAFREYGLPVGQGEPEVVADRIRRRPAAVRDALLVALYDWGDVAHSTGMEVQEPHGKWLRAVLEAAEPANGWGRRVRAAMAGKGPAERQAALEALAKSAKVADLPPQALTRLARILSPAPAAELLRRAQRQYPANFWINFGLGKVLQTVAPPERDEAMRFLTAAVALRPVSAGVHSALGYALSRNGQVDAAIASYQKAVELDPKLARTHHNLGKELKRKGQVDEAIACYRKALELAPKYARVHYDLGFALYGQGQVDAAIACYQKALDLNPKYAEARASLAKAQRLSAVQDKLLALRKGDFQPKSNRERLPLIELCLIKKLYRAAADLSAIAFAADPTLADNVIIGHRYNAACSAALTAVGQGEDAAKLDEQERARLRRQALDWLRADLAVWPRLVESDQPAVRNLAKQRLRHWQQDGDLASLRDTAALAKLPAEERAACAQLWADVAALLRQAEAKSK